MNPIIDFTEEKSEIDGIASKAYWNGYGRGFGAAAQVILTLPFESMSEEFVINMIKAEVGKGKFFRCLLPAVESTYTNKRGKTHICWRTKYGKYLKPKKEDEKEYTYVGFDEWDYDRHSIVFTRERYELTQEHRCLGAFVVKAKAEPKREETKTEETKTQSPPKKVIKKIKINKRRICLKK